MVTVSSHGAFGENESYQQLDVDKFAELLLAECLTRIRGTYLANWDEIEDLSDFENGYTKGVQMCIKMVKQHFEIKEEL